MPIAPHPNIYILVQIIASVTNSYKLFDWSVKCVYLLISSLNALHRICNEKSEFHLTMEMLSYSISHAYKSGSFDDKSSAFSRRLSIFSHSGNQSQTSLAPRKSYIDTELQSIWFISLNLKCLSRSLSSSIALYSWFTEWIYI